MPQHPDPVTSFLADGMLFLVATCSAVCGVVWLGRSLGWWN